MPVVIVSGLPVEISFHQLLSTLRKILDKDGTSKFWLKDLSSSPGSQAKQAKIEFNSDSLALMAENQLDGFVLDYHGEEYPLFACSPFAPNLRGAPSLYRGGMQRGSHHSGPSQQEQRPYFQGGRGQSIPQFNSAAGASRGRGQSRPHYNHPRGGMQPSWAPSAFQRQGDNPRPNYEAQRERSSELDNIKSQSSKLDMEIELLRKQRLVIEEERKLLLEKQKLAQVRELGPKDHFYGQAHSHDFGPERSFGGPQMDFRGGISYRGGRGHQGPGRGYPLPQMRGNPRFKRPGLDFLARYPQDHKTQRFEYNHTHPSQRYSKSSKMPLFHTSCNILIEQMRPLLSSECTSNTETSKVTEQIKIILRSRLSVALQNVKTIMAGSDKAKLYRKLYSESTDKTMIEKILRQIRERRADSEIKGKEEKSDKPAEAKDDVNNGIGDEISETVDLNSTLTITTVDETMDVDSTVEDKASLKEADEDLKVADKNLEEADKALEVADKNLEANSEVKDKHLEEAGDTMEEVNLKEADNNLVEPSSPEQAKLRERVTCLELGPTEGRLTENILEEENLLLGN